VYSMAVDKVAGDSGRWQWIKWQWIKWQWIKWQWQAAGGSVFK
jgi:hypothetical protein